MRLLFILSFLIIINISVLVSPVNGHIAEQKVAEEIKLDYEYNLLISDQRLIEKKSRSEIIKLIEIENQYLFDPIVIFVTLDNYSEGEISNQDNFPTQRIELLLDFPSLTDEYYQPYPTEILKISERGVIAETYTKIVDPSLTVGNIRDFGLSIDALERDRSYKDSNRIPIDVSLRLTDRTWKSIEQDRKLLISYEIFTYSLSGVSEDSFHNDINFKTKTIERLYFWRLGENISSQPLYILLPIELAEFVFEHTLWNHAETEFDLSTAPNFELVINLNLTDILDPNNYDDFDLSINHGFNELDRQKKGNRSFEYKYKFNSQVEQFLYLTMTNHGFPIGLYITSVVIKIPAIFYEHNPTTSEKILSIVITYKYLLIILGALLALSVPPIMRENHREYQARLQNRNFPTVARVFDKSHKVKPWVPGKTIGRRITGAGSWEWPIKPGSSTNTNPTEPEKENRNEPKSNLKSEREEGLEKAFQKLRQIKQNGIKNKNDFRYFNTIDTLPHTVNSRIQNQSKINQFPRMRFLPSSSFYDKKKDHSIQLPKTKFGNIGEIAEQRPSKREEAINHKPKSRIPKFNFPRSKPNYTPKRPLDSYNRSEYSWTPNRNHYSQSTSFGFGSSQRQYVRRSNIGRISSMRQRKIQRLRNQKEIENYKNTSQGFWNKVKQSLLKIIYGTLISLSNRKSKRNGTNKNGTNNSQNSSIPNSNHKEEDILSKIIEYLIEGKSIAWIARLFGLDRNYLYDLAIRLQQNRIIYHCKGIREEKKNRKDMGIEPKEIRQIPKQDTKKVYSKSAEDFITEGMSQLMQMGPKSIHNSQLNDSRTLNVLLKMFKILSKRKQTRAEYKILKKINLRDNESWERIESFRKNYRSERDLLKDFAYHFCLDLFNDISLLFPKLHLDPDTERQFHRYIGRMRDGKFYPSGLARVIEHHPGGNWDLEVGRVNTPLIFLGEIEALIRTAKMLADTILREYEMKSENILSAIKVAWQKGPTGERRLEKDLDDNSASGPDGLVMIDVKKLLGQNFDPSMHPKFEFVFVEGKTQSTFHKTRQLVYIKKSPSNKAYVGSDLILKVSSVAPLFDAIYNMYYQDPKAQKEFGLVFSDYYERIKEDVNLAKLEFLSDKVKKPNNQLFMRHDGYRWRNISLEEVNRNRLHDLNFSLSLRKRDGTLTDKDYHQLSYEYLQLFGPKTVDDDIQDLIKKGFSEEKIELNQINIDFTLFPDSIFKRRDGTTKFLMITGDISDERLAELSLKGHCIAFRSKDGDIVSQFSKLVQFEYQPNARHFSKSFSIPAHYKHSPKDYLNIHRGYHQSVPWSDFVNFAFKGRSKLKSVWFPSTMVGGMTYRNELPLRSSSGSLSTSTGVIVSGELTSLDMTAAYVGRYLDKPAKTVPTPRIRMDIRHPCEFEEKGEMKCKDAIQKGASPNTIMLPPSKKTGRRSSTFIDNLIDDSLWNQLENDQKNTDLSQFKGYFQKTRSSVLRAYNNAKNISDGGQNDGKSGIAKWWCYGCGVKRVDGLIQQFAANMKNRGVSDQFLEMWKKQYFSEYI